MNNLNLFKVIKNNYFKKISFFDKKKINIILLFSIVSTAIYTSFPLVTQFYILYAYRDQTMKLLIYGTVAFLLMFIFKLLIDIRIEKYKIKYFLKIEKNIKELIIGKYRSKLKKFITYKSDYLSKHLHLYIMLIKTVYYNILDITKIIIAFIIIYFFDKNLFIYFLYSLPFFMLFYFIGKKIELKYQPPLEEEKNDYSSFQLLIKDTAYKNLNEKSSKKIFMKHLENDFKKRMENRQKLVPLHTTMMSFISFYRLFYLAYFGYYMITADIRIGGLIVSLLFITILIRPFVRLLKSAHLYVVCKNSFIKINSLYK